MSKVIVDTNILIYGLDKDSQFHQRAVSFLVDPDHQLFITTKNISEYFSVSSKLQIGEEKIFGFYGDLIINTVILYPSSVSIQNFERLVKKYNPKGNRVYDVEIVSIMVTHEISKIATLNNDDFKFIEEVEIIQF